MAGPRRGEWAVIVLLLVAASAVLMLAPHLGRRPAPAFSPGAPAPSPAPAAAISPQGGRPHLSPNGEEPSHVADDLDSDRTDIHGDLRLVNELFDQYRSAVHGLNPVGENPEITAVLAGKNKLGFAFLAPDSRAINAQGELVDRWGTPFFFHQVSGDQMEIRSAGPDRKLYTPDDEVLTPGLAPPHL